MGILFISHSSRNNDQAIEVRDWLREHGWRETFLDLDPEHGLAPGQRWQEELKKAGERCSAVVVLISPDWVASKWCQVEFLVASQLGKRIFGVIIARTPFAELPIELTAYQLVDISDPATKPDGFERLRFGLKRAGLDPRDFPWPPPNEPDRPAYRGLRSLDEEDAGIFFGRDAPITRGLDDLRRMRDGTSERMLVILGASGAGKSSFLKAGLLARLLRDEEHFLVLPTVRPERAALTGPRGLLRALGLSAQLSEQTIQARLAEIRQPAIARLQLYDAEREKQTTKPPTLILPIDQAEELFSSDNPESAASLDLLKAAFAADANFIAVVTIRSDSFSQLQGETQLAQLPRLPFDLPRLSLAAFNEVIEGPGRLAKPEIQVDPALTDRLAADFSSPDALPLLAFTLERLVTEYGKGGKLELREFVEGLGGLEGAINQAVEAAFAAARRDPALPNEQAELEALARCAFLPWLVSVDDADGPPKRRVALMSELPAQASGLVRHLVNQRLLVSDLSTVEVSHEVVLRHWPALAVWIGQERDALHTLDAVKAAAREFRRLETAQASVQRDTWLVHRGERLANAELLLGRPDYKKALGDEGSEYLAACRSRENADRKEAEERLRREVEAAEARAMAERKTARLLKVVVGIVVLGLIGVGYFAYRSNAHRKTAQEQLARNYWETSRTARDGKQTLASLHWAAEALSLEPAKALAAALLLEVKEILPQTSLSEILQHDGSIRGAVFSRDESRILTWSDDHTARLWDVATGQQLGPSLRHDSPVSGAVFNRDESRILTWSDDHTARLWDVATGKPSGPSLQHNGSVSGAVFSQDESRILTWSDDKTARLWDVATGKQLGPSLRHNDWVSGAVFSRDESRILTWSGDDTARLWDVATGKQLGPSIQHDDPSLGVSGAVFNRDESRILTWSEDDTARLWDVATGKQLGPSLRHDDSVRGAIFNRDESRILTWSDDKTARLWDVATGQQLSRSLRHDGTVSGAVFNRDGSRTLTWSDDKTARLWDVATGKQLGPSLQHDDPSLGVSGAVFNRDESRILTWSDDKTARLWDVATGQQLGPSLRHDDSVRGAIFNRDESRILTWSDDKTARLWDVATGQQLSCSLRHGASVRGAVFNRDESRILTWSDDKTARFWDVATGQQLGPSLQHDDSDRGPVFNRDESRILTWSDDKTARLWDVATGQQLGPSLQHGASVRGAVFSRDESRILTWSLDKTARLWDVATGKQLGPSLQDDSPVSGAVFNRDESRILTWSYKMARLWDVATGKPSGPSLQHDDPSKGVRGAIFNRDESRILTWSGDKTARLWDVATGQQLGPSLRHDDSYPGLRGAVFNRDGSRILTWGGDDTARLWDVATGKQLGPSLQHDRTVSGAVFSRDESRILTWSQDETARLWDVATGKPSGPSLQHNGSVSGAVFSRDESRILTWSEDDTARLWDVATGKRLGPSLRHDSPFKSFNRGAVFNRDESRVLTWSYETARLWDVAVDLDFPFDRVKTQLMAMTGTEFDPLTSQIKIIDPERWRAIRREYVELASQHLRVCKFPTANQWQRFTSKTPQ